MKKKLVKLILAVAMCLLALGSLCACSIGESEAGDRLNENGMDGKTYVRYYGNGGTFNGTNNVFEKEIHYKPNTPVININSTGTPRIERSEYVIAGWSYAVLDEDGKPVYEDESKGIVKAGEAVDFSTFKIQKGKSYHFVANWIEDIYVDYVLVSDVTVKTTDGVEYQNGDTIKKEYFGLQTEIAMSSKAPLKSSTSTFLQYYRDQECTQPITSAVQKPADGNAKVYVKYIEGEWTVVNNATAVRNMIEQIGNGETKYWILNDIDCLTVNLRKNFWTFEGEIKGNGYTLSNLKMSIDGIKNGDLNDFSLLGELKSGSKITDLTLDGISITYALTGGRHNLYAIASGAQEGAIVSGLTIKNVTMTVSGSDSAEPTNLFVRDGETKIYDEVNWLFGGVAPDGADRATDEAFIAKFSGITLDKTNCVLNNNYAK